MPRAEEREFPVPFGYEDRGGGWVRAFQHAMEHHNSEKASIQYAEHHHDDFTGVEEIKPTE